jgi:hypothetical protein
MTRPGFWRELGIAFAISVTGAVGFHLANALLGPWIALRLLVAGAGAAFALGCLAAAPTRVGRVAAAMLFVALDIALAVFHAPLWMWAATQVFALWLLRCSYFHRSAFTALGDLVVATCAIAAAWTALLHNGSAFLALWTFGLVQALYVFIPATIATVTPATPINRFDQAQRTAQAALRRMTTA